LESQRALGQGSEIVDAENALFLIKGSRVYHVHRIECCQKLFWVQGKAYHRVYIPKDVD